MAISLSSPFPPSAAAASSSPLCHGVTAADWQAAHDAIKAHAELWQSLAFDGIQHDGTGGLVEQRRCPHCGSTLSQRITADRALELCHRQTAAHAHSIEAVLDATRAAVPRAPGSRP